MDSPYKTERLDAGKPADLARAAQLLRAGETVAFPTETVYGLGANALSPAAVAKIFAAKQRPSWDPLIVHIADRAALELITIPSPDPAPIAALTARFWPGPLTLLLPRSPAIPDAVTAGRALVGVRMPAHPVALELLRQAGLPIAAPSANRFGHTSPTTAQHVLDDLDGRIAAVLDGGPTGIGLESTVAEVSFEEGPRRPFVRIYRPGAIDRSMLEELAIGRVDLYAPPHQARPESLPSPGVGIRHYAPRAQLLLVPVAAKQTLPFERSLTHAIAAATTAQGKVGVLLPEHWDSSAAELTYPWGPWGEPETLARRLFAGLRNLDDRGATVIVAPLPEPGGLRDAIRDRLLKAALRPES